MANEKKILNFNNFSWPLTPSWPDHIFSSSPGGIPARNAKGERLLLYLGIIDILQSFRLKKRLEHTVKAMVIDGVCCTHFSLLAVCFTDIIFVECFF